MKKLALLLMASTLFLSSGKMTGNKVKEAPFYGKKITATSALSLDQVTREFKKHDGQEITFDAKVGSVCVKKGCWMTLENKSGSTRVKFKDYSFFVPITLVGTKVRVTGVFTKKVLSKEEAKHYLKDSGVKNPKITSPVVEYSVLASGVQKI